MTSLQGALEHWIALASIARDRVRARVFAVRGASIAHKARFGPGCKVERPWCVKIGSRFHAEAGVYLKVVSDEASLEFGDHVFVGRGTEFDVMGEVSVGDHTVIAPGCFITDHNHGTSPTLGIDQQACIAGPVIIGSDVWLGANVVVLPGVSIGDGAVVGANAVVTHNVPSMAIVVGVPAGLLRYREASAQAAEETQEQSIGR